MRNQILPRIGSLKTWCFLSCFLAFFSFASSAQVATSYQFTQSSGTYTPITGTVLVSGTFDDGIFAVTIPTFKFNGTNFTTMYVNENGWVGFRAGGTITSTSSYNPISAGPTADGIISPFGRDLNNAASGTPSVSWAVVGTEVVVQWQDVRRYSSTSTEDLSFQLHLDTVTGVISVVYSAVTGTTTVTTNPQIGLRGANNTFATNVNNRQLASGGLWNATSNGTSNSSTVYIDDATSAPTAGQIFRWVPVTCFPPTGVTTANVTTNSTDINWTAPTSGTPAAYGWEVVAHGAGPYATPIAYNYVFGTTANTGAVLSPNTQYDVYVKTGCSLSNLSDTSLWSSVATFTTLATCIAPSALTASGATTSGASISWTASPSAPANGYVYEAVASGAGYGATPVESGSVAAGATSATFSSLQPATTYDLYVRAACSSTDSSSWIGPVSITTLCVPVSSFPWTEGFEGIPTVGANVYPNCWSYTNITSNNYSCATTCNSNSAHTGSKFIGGSWSFNVWEYTPGFQLTAGTYYDYSFWYKTTDATAGYVVASAYGTAANAASMTNLLGTITNASSSGAYTKVTYTFQVPSSGVYYFGLHDSCPTSAPNGIAFDDFSLQLSPTCQAPTALTLSGSTATSASVSWTASLSAPANGYIYEAVASGAGASGTPVATGTTAAGVTSATVTGLSANTAYDIYVRGVCSSTDTSTWLGPLSLTTPCAAITTLPWSEGFETLPATAGANVYPTCWAYTNLSSNNYSCSATCNSNTAHAGTNFIGGSWSFNVWEYTPGFQLTAGTYYDYSFWYRTTDATNGYVVASAFGTAPARSAMTNALGTITNAVSSGAYTKVTYTFQVPTTGVYYFGLHDSCPTSAPNGIAFDDFSLQLTPACTVPTALSTGVATGSSVSFSWTASVSNPINGYNWKVVASGAGPTGTAVAAGAVGAGVTSATASGLTAQTAYDIYVQSNCGVDSSAWAGPLSVTTPCNAITTLPWSEGFETLPAAAGANVYPACWTYSNISSNNYTCSATCNSNTAHAGTNFMGGSWNFNVWEYTPGFQLTAGTNYDYSFWYRTTDATNGYVVASAYGTAPNSGAMTTTLGTITNAVSSGSYTKVTYTFQVPATGVYYFGHHDSCPTFAPNGIAFDDFSLQLSPNCVASGVPTLTSATSTGAVISWTASLSAPANGYIWKAVTSGAGVSGTAVASGTTAAGVTTATITGLSANTAYDVYVRSVCSATDSSTWAGPLSFTTPCASVGLPLIEGFNSTSRPACWSEQNVSGTGVLYYTNTMSYPTTAPQEGTDFVEYNSYNSPTTAGVEKRLVSPPIVTTGTPSVDISFYWVHDATNYTTGSYLNEGMTVQYSTDGTTWTDVQFFPRVDLTLQPTGSAWFQKQLTLPAAVANQPVVYIGFKFHSEYGNNCAFDNLHLYATPACAGAPTALQTGTVTSNTASVNWTAASPAPAVGYHWIVTPTGAGPGAGIDSGNVTGDTANITGLTPNTVYDFYVQSDCGGGSGLGSLAGPISFQTSCTNATLPLIEGFNSTSIPSCWSQQYVSGTNDLQYLSASYNPTTTPQEGADYVFWNGYGISAGGETRLVSPPITSTGIPSVDLSFYFFNEHSTYYNAGNYLNEGVTVQYSTDGTNWTDVQFFPREDASLASGTGMWKQKYVTLPAGAGNQPTLYVGFNFHSEYGDNVSFDNLHIFQSSPCAGGPTNIGVTPTTTTTATASWTAGSPAPANGYHWVVVARGDSVNGTVISSDTTAAGVTTASITGLTASTSYDIYVQSNCGSPLGVGYWVGPVSFTTPCNAITTLPWTEHFEGLTTVGTDIVPSCWLPTPSGRWESDDAPFFFPALNARSGTHFITDRYNSDDTIYTPSFTLTGGTQYEFYFYYQTDGYTGWDSLYALAGTMQSPAGMTTRVGTTVSGATNTQYVKYSGFFTPATSGDYFFAVRLHDNGGPSNIAFDDFGLQEVVPCPNPPLAGTISGLSSVCPSTAVNLTLSGYSPYTQLQWQASLDSVNWQDLIGANNDFYTDYPSTLTYYRVKVNCADSAYSPVFAVNMNAPNLCYCTAGLGGGCGGNDIDTALIQGTNFFVNYTTCNTTTGGDAYTAFPVAGDSTTSLQRGGSYTIYLHMTGTSISSVWIDYDHSGTFDASEWVQPTVAANSGTAVLNVPAGALLGTTGMRIRSRNQGNTNGANSACSNFGSGETFDFQITIVDTNCSHTPTVTPTVTAPTCYGSTNGSLSIALTGGVAPFSHSWSTGDTTTSLTNLAAGVYTDTITFAGGCTYIYRDTITQPAVLAATDTVTPVLCYGAATGTVTVTVTGGTTAYTHHWSNGATSAQLTGVVAGTYTDTITDANGCRLVLRSDTVRQPASAVSIVLDSAKAAKCNGQSNGAIYTTARGGTGAYTYTWTGSAQTTDDLTGLAAGAYTVTVKDANQCSASLTDTVTQPAPVTIVTDSIVNAKCHSSNGSIYVHATGGTLPYGYLWTPGNVTTSILFSKPAGAYTLSVTDRNGCTASATDTIQAPAALTLSSNITNQVQNGTQGSITVTATGGTQPYRYSWSNGATTSTISSLNAGPYAVTVTDANGCTASRRDTVDLILGIKDAGSNITNIYVYPNPSAGIFNVAVKLTHAMPVELEVYTVTGQQINVATKENTATETFVLDMNGEAAGIYVVKVKAGDQVVTQRVTLIK